MSRHLFLFTIGPVQSFIAQARKTQDLYSGSLILSDLIDEAINTLDKSGIIDSNDLIFPNRKIQSKPNRLLAILKTDDPDKIGNDVEDAVRRRFKASAEKALKKSSIRELPELRSHIENFLGIYWVALPYNGNYSEKYEEIERLLGAVKNVRAFNQLPEAGRKCALCGERNVLFYKTTGPNDRKSFISNAADIPKSKYQFIKGEGLCGVCSFKRFYKKESFPSTANIALMHTLYKMRRNPEGCALWYEYKNIFRDSHFEEQLLYEENLTPKYLEKQGFDEFAGRLPEIQWKQKKIREFAKNESLRLPRYYAVIAFDGDSMGKWLSGEKIKNKESNLKQFHQRISELLGNFAEFSMDCLKDPLDNKTIVTENDFFGKAVYAGGDDFLGFVNLNHLFYVLKNLRKEFDEQVSKPLSEDFEFKTPDGKMTFSAGIAIAHYKTPLSIALDWARAMEKKAKQVDGKDAVGFALLKHSGNIAQSIVKWKYNGLNDQTMSLATELSKALKEWVSNKFLYSLREEFLHLIDEETHQILSLRFEIQSEIRRLIHRRKNKEGLSKIESDKERQEKYISRLAEQLADLIFEIEKMKKTELNTFHNFLGFLEICNFVSREMNK